METKLMIQVEAVVKYIDCLLLCEDNNLERKEAYSMVINHFRVESGLKAFDGVLNPRLQKFIDCLNSKEVEK